MSETYDNLYSALEAAEVDVDEIDELIAAFRARIDDSPEAFKDALDEAIKEVYERMGLEFNDDNEENDDDKDENDSEEDDDLREALESYAAEEFDQLVDTDERLGFASGDADISDITLSPEDF